MPASYQAPRRGANDKKTRSQSASTNTSSESATVSRLIENKGRDVFSIKPDQTLADAVVALRDRSIGALLVMDDSGALVGILSERDIVRKLAETPGKTLPHAVSDVMTSKVETCNPGETLVSVLRRMTQGRFRHMPIEDSSGVIGMLTIGDVVNFRLTELEHEALQLKQLIVG